MATGDSVVLVNTLWRTTSAIAAVNITTGEVARLSPPTGSFSVLLNAHKRVYAAWSSMAHLPGVCMLNYATAKGGSSDSMWDSLRSLSEKTEGVSCMYQAELLTTCTCTINTLLPEKN